jgi:hypothetical protein
VAENSPITADHEWFIGADHQFEFGPMLDGDGAPVNIAAWTMSWMLKRKLSDLDAAALLTKVPTITGSYSATVASNTQRAVVTIADTDTDAFVARDNYQHELKRTDAGSEQVLAYGKAVLKRGVHRT